MDTPRSQDFLAIVGMGYVGLPLAVAFGATRPTIGFDINEIRIKELQNGSDRTHETTKSQLRSAKHLIFTSTASDLNKAHNFIVTVPTPVTAAKTPDLGPLMQASATVGGHMKSGSLVVFESTVYPGATEEICVPILERHSGLVFNEDFFVGYSPERINPGDSEHGLKSVVKITSGSTPETANAVDRLYREIVTAGTHRASTIRVAEAAKVIENIQRDVNIALINELAVLFQRLNIDTQEVLAAAGSKWNFLKFTPGLVGGHCIGVDPYYLTHIAQRVGHHPELILAGRRQNDYMGYFVGSRVLRLMLERGIDVSQSRVLVLGLAFKENCPDIRNTKVIDVIRELVGAGVTVDVVDPWVDPTEALAEFNIELLAIKNLPNGNYDGIVFAVPHEMFSGHINSLTGLLRGPGIIFDVKGTLPDGLSDARL